MECVVTTGPKGRYYSLTNLSCLFFSFRRGGHGGPDCGTDSWGLPGAAATSPFFRPSLIGRRGEEGALYYDAWREMCSYYANFSTFHLDQPFLPVLLPSQCANQHCDETCVGTEHNCGKSHPSGTGLIIVWEGAKLESRITWRTSRALGLGRSTGLEKKISSRWTKMRM